MKLLQMIGIALGLFFMNAPAHGEGATSKESLDLEIKTNDQGKTFTVTFGVNDEDHCLLTPKTVALAAPMGSAQLGIPTPPMGRIGFETVRGPCKRFPGPSRGEITFVFGNKLPSVKAGYYVLFIDGQMMGKIVLIDSKGNPSLIEPNAIPQ
jgi:hypothetical protein